VLHFKDAVATFCAPYAGLLCVGRDSIFLLALKPAVLAAALPESDQGFPASLDVGLAPCS
jgi:hypothetical protein